MTEIPDKLGMRYEREKWRVTPMFLTEQLKGFSAINWDGKLNVEQGEDHEFSFRYIKFKTCTRHLSRDII